MLHKTLFTVLCRVLLYFTLLYSTLLYLFSVILNLVQIYLSVFSLLHKYNLPSLLPFVHFFLSNVNFPPIYVCVCVTVSESELEAIVKAGQTLMLPPEVRTLLLHLVVRCSLIYFHF